MFYEGGMTGKAAATGVTRVGLLTCVYTYVDHLIRLLRKGVVTELAPILSQPLVDMAAYMDFKTILRVEHLGTFEALVFTVNC